MTEEAKSESEKKKEDWMNAKWRPMMGWMYMVVCMMDMVIFPILWSLLQTLTHTQITQWNPLTLQGAGLFHIAMGAVLGIAAFGRTQEKLNGANNGGLQTTAPAVATPAPTFSAPAVSTPAPSFGAPATAPAFKPAPSFGAPTGVSSTGKPMPMQPDHPEI
jgi:Holin of 3TMs, for gene-transfer release